MFSGLWRFLLSLLGWSNSGKPLPDRGIAVAPSKPSVPVTGTSVTGAPVTGAPVTGVTGAVSSVVMNDVLYPVGLMNYEERFAVEPVDSDGTRYSVVLKRLDGLTVRFLSPEGIEGYYYAERVMKEAVVLHFTVGFLPGDIATLVEPGSGISAPFVIARDGAVYQLFDEGFWAYHLGRAALGGNTRNSKRTIAVELSNIGPLCRNGDILNTLYGRRYCHMDETAFYTVLEKEYRGYRYFASFTRAQYASLDLLLSYLCRTYAIPRTLLPVSRRYDVFASAADACAFRGICSHVNFRAYGKVDIGPAFDWSVV